MKRTKTKKSSPKVMRVKAAYKLVIKDLKKRRMDSCPKCNLHDFSGLAQSLEEIILWK